MKKLKLLSFAAAGMLFAACSSNDVVDNGNGGEKDGKGFISVTINLPTTPSTRALNDNYDDGDPGEYVVNNAMLLLFHGSSEADATFYYANDLTLPIVKDEDNDNITTSYQSVAQVDDTYTKDLWALVLINYNDVFKLSDLTIEANKAGATGKYKLESGTTTISDLQTAITELPLQAKDNFFMTNAVLSNVSGGNASAAPAKSNLNVLVKLADDCIKDTEAEAKNNPAGSIFVERAVAKATLRIGKDACNEIDGLEIEPNSIEWCLDNMESTSYLVRNMGEAEYMGYSSEAFATPNYRFAGHVKLGTTPIQPEVDYYRTYWCVDPQYSDNVSAAKMRRGSDSYVGLNTPQYCHENTFDVAHQTYRNTTRAIIKVQTTSKDDFYTVNGANKKYTLDDAQTYLQKAFIEDAGLKAAIEKNLKSGIDPVKLIAESFTWDWNIDESTGKYTIDGSNTKISNSLATNLKDGFDATEINNAIAGAAATANNYVEVLKYTKGVMYYEARFMHFASNINTEDLAPWNTWETTKPAVGGVTEAYPANTKGVENNYLGRYGMVRNNWYDVEITKFGHIGSPVEPGAVVTPEGGDDTPDDNVNSKYISVKINVLSWAKRIQGWIF